MPGIRFAHTNLVALDWRSLSTFYQEVFECVPTGVERDYIGETMDRVTGMSGVRVSKQHLRLPGHEDAGPTLEIFQYEALGGTSPNLTLQESGFAHLAFEVDDLHAKQEEIIKRGARDVR